MMANRIVRDGVLDSERYLALAHDCERLLFLELLLLADDFALVPVGYTTLARKASSCLRRNEDAVAAMLMALADRDLIRPYESEAGSRFAWIPRFRNTPRAKRPKFPVPPNVPSFRELHDLLASVGHRAMPAGLPCPHDDIQRLYNEKLGSVLPAARLWGADRERAAAARWAEIAKAKGWQEVAEGVEWFGRFFDAVQEDDFLMGRTGRGSGHESWECTVDYLLSPRGFRRVFEGAGRRKTSARVAA